MMETRDFVADDYPTVQAWWTARSRPAPRLNYLPRGIIVEGKACGFLYTFKEIDAAWPGMLISNPENSYQESQEALRMVLAGLMQMTRDLGIAGMQAFPQGIGLQRMHEELGFMGSPASVREFTIEL